MLSKSTVEGKFRLTVFGIKQYSIWNQANTHTVHIKYDCYFLSMSSEKNVEKIYHYAFSDFDKTFSWCFDFDAIVLPAFFATASFRLTFTANLCTRFFSTKFERVFFNIHPFYLRCSTSIRYLKSKAKLFCYRFEPDLFLKRFSIYICSFVSVSYRELFKIATVNIYWKS